MSVNAICRSLGRFGRVSSIRQEHKDMMGEYESARFSNDVKSDSISCKDSSKRLSTNGLAPSNRKSSGWGDQGGWGSWEVKGPPQLFQIEVNQMNIWSGMGGGMGKLYISYHTIFIINLSLK